MHRLQTSHPSPFYKMIASLIHPILGPRREYLDNVIPVANEGVRYQPIWSLGTFGMAKGWKKLSSRMTTSTVRI